MKITKRDTAILKWLGIFIALYLIWTFVFIPMDKKNEANRMLLRNLRIQEETTKATLPLRESVAAQKLDVQALIESQFKLFFDDTTTAQKEAFFIPFLTQFDVRFQYFEVSPTTVVVPKSTLSSKEDITYKIKVLIDEYSAIIKPTVIIPTTESELLKTTITYIVGMSFAEFQRMCDAVNQLNNAIILTVAEYDFKDASAELSFDIYSMSKLNFQP